MMGQRYLQLLVNGASASGEVSTGDHARRSQGNCFRRRAQGTRDGSADEHSRDGRRKEPCNLPPHGWGLGSKYRHRIDKAFTSAGRGLTTRKIGEMAQPGQSLFGINTTNGGRIVIFAGGIPLTRDGEVAGAIGVSGGTVDEDHEVAEAGVAAFD